MVVWSFVVIVLPIVALLDRIGDTSYPLQLPDAGHCPRLWLSRLR
jgi:hypothetical protein